MLLQIFLAKVLQVDHIFCLYLVVRNQITLLNESVQEVNQALLEPSITSCSPHGYDNFLSSPGVLNSLSVASVSIMGLQRCHDMIGDPNIIGAAESGMIFKHLPLSAITYLSFRMPYRIVRLGINSNTGRVQGNIVN